MLDMIATDMRKAELARREERRKHLLRLIENEGALLHEELSQYGKQIHAAAVANIIKQKLAFEKETQPNYWKRLWFALLGK